MSDEKKSPTVLDALSGVSGISRPEILAIAEKVKANGERLHACPGPHDLEDITPEKPIGKTFRCKKCEGELRGTDALWYRDGLAHGRAEAAAKIVDLEKMVAHLRRVNDAMASCPNLSD